MQNFIIREFNIEKDDLSIGAVSLVDDPAIEKDFQLFSKQNKWSFKTEEFKIFSSDKQIISGPVLLPNKFIFRYFPGGAPGYVYFTKKTVLELMKKFNVNFSDLKLRIDHDTDLRQSQYKVISSSYRNGQWEMSIKILDDRLWNKIKSEKKWKGFSIELELN